MYGPRNGIGKLQRKRLICCSIAMELTGEMYGLFIANLFSTRDGHGISETVSPISQPSQAETDQVSLWFFSSFCLSRMRLVRIEHFALCVKAFRRKESKARTLKTTIGKH